MNQIMLVVLFQSIFLYLFIYLFADGLAWRNIYIFPIQQNAFSRLDKECKVFLLSVRKQLHFPRGSKCPRLQRHTQTSQGEIWQKKFLLCFCLCLFYLGCSLEVHNSHRNSFRESAVFDLRHLSFWMENSTEEFNIVSRNNSMLFMMVTEEIAVFEHQVMHADNRDAPFHALIYCIEGRLL